MCSLHQILDIHILFKNFRVWEDLFWTGSSLNQFEFLILKFQFFFIFAGQARLSVGFLLTVAGAHTLGRAHRLASPSTSCTRSPLTRDPMLHVTSSCSWPLLLGRSRSSPSLPTSSGPHPPPLIPPPSRTVTPPLLLCYCATIKNATGDLVDPPALVPSQLACARGRLAPPWPFVHVGWLEFAEAPSIRRCTSFFVPGQSDRPSLFPPSILELQDRHHHRGTPSHRAIFTAKSMCHHSVTAARSPCLAACPTLTGARLDDLTAWEPPTNPHRPHQLWAKCEPNIVHTFSIFQNWLFFKYSRNSFKLPKFIETS
jgi:hypothetical protein